MAWAWLEAPLHDRTVLLHEGGTGGFSSFIALDLSRERVVVVLADTQLASTGGLSSLGMHLIDSSIPLGSPRREVDASADRLASLAGRYRSGDGVEIALRELPKGLVLERGSNEMIDLQHDSMGNFYSRQRDLIVRPRGDATKGGQLLIVEQGSTREYARVDRDSEAVGVAAAATAKPLQDYVGIYRINPAIALDVAQGDAGLTLQAPGQGKIPLQPTERDVFRADGADIEIRFFRDGAGSVERLEIHQGGRITRAALSR